MVSQSTFLASWQHAVHYDSILFYAHTIWGEFGGVRALANRLPAFKVKQLGEFSSRRSFGMASAEGCGERRPGISCSSAR